jgi:hypothetical protein
MILKLTNLSFFDRALAESLSCPQPVAVPCLRFSSFKRKSKEIQANRETSKWATLKSQLNWLNDCIEDDSLENLHETNVVLQSGAVVTLMNYEVRVVDFESLRRVLCLKNLMRTKNHYSFCGILEFWFKYNKIELASENNLQAMSSSQNEAFGDDWSTFFGKNTWWEFVCIQMLN